MGKTSFIRARGEEQIEVRRKELMEAAQRLYKRYFFDEINIRLLAKESGFTRSNIYRYYASKEEVYLNLLLLDVNHWATLTEKWLIKTYSSSEFAQKWIENILAEKRLLSLFSILSTKLEPNSSQKALDDFKQELVSQTTRVVKAIQTCYPQLTEQDIQLFLMFNSSVCIGTFPNMYASKKQKQAMKKSGLPTDPEDYKFMLVTAIRVFFENLLNQHK